MTGAATFGDEAVLRRAVGAETLSRGQRYAEDGAVIGAHWDDEGERVVGQVRGNGPRPYTAIAIIDSTPDGMLRSFRGACTCPVGTNCKHAVALALVRPGRAVTSTWERRLRSLGRPPEPADRIEKATVGLQFELVTPRAHDLSAHLNLRPVLAGSNGNWVRTGISWSGLHLHQYSTYRKPALSERHVDVLTEIKALAYAVRHPASISTIDLTDYASRRLWSLLADAADSGIALVQARAKGAPVRLHRDPVEIDLDIDRQAGGLQLRPRLVSSESTWPAQDSVLLGPTPHGVAWRATDGLHLAPLTGDLDDSMRELICGEPVHVPVEDVDRFFSAYYPQLSRRLPTTSSTGSVELPTLDPPALVLTVHHDRADQVRVGWHWRYRVGTAVRDEPYWPDYFDDTDRDHAAEEKLRNAVTDVLAPLAAVFEPMTIAREMAGGTALRGSDAIAFVSTFLPRLSKIDGVEIDTVGTPVEYERLDGATEIVFADTATDGDWFDLSVSVRVGGEELPFERLFVALATGEQTLILSDGRYLDLDRPELRRLAAVIAESRSLQDAPPRTVRVNRYEAGTWDELAELGAINGPAAQWQRTVRALTDTSQLTEVAVPTALQATLRPYQQDGLRWLAFLYDHGLGGVLADDMGLGKTVQTLALICHADAPAPFLIVAPTSVMSNWVAEAARFAPSLRVRAITETTARRREDLAEAVGDADIVVTSYTLFRMEFEAYDALNWSGLVLDEAQAAKNHLSHNYACAKKLRAPFKLAVTGTPMENHLGELWACSRSPRLGCSPRRASSSSTTAARSSAAATPSGWPNCVAASAR